MAKYALHPTAAVTPSDAWFNTYYSPTPPYVVGGPAGIWSDDDDGTYAALETFEHPDVSYADSAAVDLPVNPAITTNPALVKSVTARVRCRALAVEMKPPQVYVSQSPASFDTARVLGKAPTGAASMTADWIDIPLDFIRLQDFLNGAALGDRSLRMEIQAPYLTKYSYRSSWTHVYEAYLIVDTGPTDAPPCRIFPRSDGLGVGGGRVYPPPKSQQRSPGRRGVGYY